METDLRQIFHVHPVYHVPQGGADLRHHRGQHGLCLRLAGGLGGGPQPHLAGLGVGGEGRVHHVGHPVVEQLVHGTLPHAEGHDVAGDDDLSGEGPEIRLHTPAEHGLTLMGRTGQHQHMDAAGLEGAAGGGAHRVVEYGAALRQLRLLDVVLRHGHVEGGLIKGPDVRQNVRMEHQLLPEGLTDGLLGQVVIGGAQAAGGEDDVRPAAGDVQRLAQPLGVVPHHGVPEDVDAQGGQALGEHLGVGVGDVAQQDLRAHGDDLGGVGHQITSFQYYESFIR